MSIYLDKETLETIYNAGYTLEDIGKLIDCTGSR